MDFGINVFVWHYCFTKLFYRFAKTNEIYVKLKMVQRRNIDGDYFLSKPCQWLDMEHVFTVRYVTFSVIWYGVTLNEMFIIFSIAEMFWPPLYETFFIQLRIFHDTASLTWSVYGLTEWGVIGEEGGDGLLAVRGRRLSCKRGWAG